VAIGALPFPSLARPTCFRRPHALSQLLEREIGEPMVKDCRERVVINSD